MVSKFEFTDEEKSIIAEVDEHIARLEATLFYQVKSSVSNLKQRKAEGKPIKAAMKNLNKTVERLRDLTYNPDEVLMIYERRKRMARQLISEARQTGKVLEYKDHFRLLDLLSVEELSKADIRY